VGDVLQYVRPDYKCANTEIQPEDATWNSRSRCIYINLLTFTFTTYRTQCHPIKEQKASSVQGNNGRFDGDQM
jgi:hypothetical protein